MIEMTDALEITPEEVRRRLDSGERFHLIDVREPDEYSLAHIAGCELIPMRTVPGALAKLQSESQNAPLIIYCHHGVRSLNVVHWLREQGIGACQSMSGGIDAWSLTIDASVPRY
jgi:rhodanese-related sulfurtransferase